MAARPDLATDRLGLLVLLLLFVVGLLPVAGSFVFEHPDEKHYIDGAIAMVQSGEWLTPRWPDGALRLEKPILAFWPIALSYRVFGVSLLASRLPSLLACALVIAITYGLALTVTGRRSIALLAALIAFSEPHVILAATWATPDALLCLFILVSAWGALDLLTRERPSWWAPWATYVGAGLAIATKGLLGLVFAVFVWLFAWRYPNAGATRKPFSALFHGPSMLLGLVVAAWWYAAIAWMHGAGELGIFFKDQTVADSATRSWQPLSHVPLYAALTWASVLPWSAALIALLFGRRPHQPAETVSDPWFARFALLWSLLLVLIFSASVWVDGRYLLPAGPLLAVWLAAALAGAGETLQARALRAILLVCLVGLAAVGAAFVLLWVALSQVIAAAALLGALAAVMVAILVAWRRVSPAVGIALATFATFPLGAVGLAPVVEPDAGVRAAARELRQWPETRARSALLIGPHILASNLRVVTGGRWTVERLPIKAWTQLRAARDRWPDAIILPRAQASQLDLSGYRTREVAFGLNDVSPGLLLRALVAGRAAALLEAHRDRYVVAMRR